MPNFGADLVAGYYKTPVGVIPAIAALIDAGPARQGRGGRAAAWGRYAFLDPCAGDGEALLLCAHALFGIPFPAAGTGPRLALYGCELEATRAAALAGAFQAAKASGDASARHSDAFRLSVMTGPGAPGVSLLWANPPYAPTANPVYGRLEQAFLERFTPAVTPGTGLLVYIIPAHVLATSALYLAAQYEDLAVYRFPADEYSAYKQIVPLARRRAAPLAFGAETAAAQLTAWADHPARLPVLPDAGTVPPRFLLPPTADDGLAEFAVSSLDLTRVFALYVPWGLGTLDAAAGAPVYPLATGGRPGRRSSWQIAGDPGLGLSIDALLYQPHRTVVPPRAEHRALFAASGMFNNLPLLPDDPAAALPPAIVKGLYEKETIEVKQNVDKQGNVTSALCVQQPRMRLRLRTIGPHSVQVDLPAGSTPTGATDPAQMNIADLFAVYGNGLATWMRRMFHPLHDPADAARFVPLPPLPRALYQAQAHMVQAGIKQLGHGGNYLLQADLGTGKTTQALALLAAFGPQHYATTAARLRDLGDWRAARAPHPIHRVLVMVPPHLVATWRDERTAVLPGADIVVVERIADLYNEPPDDRTRTRTLAGALRDRRPASLGARYLGDGVNPGAGMTFFILSRETAKLGPRLGLGVVTHPTHNPAALPARTCPRCGLPVTESSGPILKQRLGCTATPLLRDRALGALAGALARLLLPAYPQNGTVAALVPDRLLRVHFFGEALPEPETADADATAEAGTADEASKADESDAPAEDLTPQDRQTQWAAWAVQPTAQGRCRLDTLLVQLAEALAAALARPAADGSPVPVLLRATQLLHLALPATLQPPRVRRAVLALARHGAALPTTDARRPPLQETLGHLLLYLLPGDQGRYDRVSAAVRRILPAGPGHDPFWTTLEHTRTRLLAEQGDAARYQAETEARPALAEAARRRQQASSPDWTDLAIHLTDGTLTWQATPGVVLPTGGVGAAALAFERLLPLGGFHRAPICGEPLHQVEPHPRRWPLADYIFHQAPARFDAFVFDELHELTSFDSAQGAAMFLLSRLPVPCLGLTGSLFNGYAGSVFLILLAFCDSIWEEFGYHDLGRFSVRYGLFKMLKELKDPDRGPQLRERGKASLRTEYSADPVMRTLGPAPGFLPALIADYMLGVSAILTQDDLAIDLPPLVEQRVALTVPREDAPGQDLLRSYRHLEARLRQQIGEDRWEKQRAGKLLGALVQLPSFLVLGTDDVGNVVDRQGRHAYEIRYPNGGDLVATGQLRPATDLLPKERWLLGQLGEQLERGRNVLVYLNHTGNAAFVARLRRLVRTHLGVEATFLDANAVDPRVRGAWIKHEVIGLKRRVLLVNPESVKTGLNELNRYFTTIIWYEGTYNVLTFRQANGRIRRIGSDPAHPIEILVPVMAATADEIAFGLVARKLVASLQFEARDLSSALDAAGAGDADTDAALQQAALASMGQAILDILEGQDALESALPQVPVTLAEIRAVVQAPPGAREYAPIDGKAAVQTAFF